MEFLKRIVAWFKALICGLEALDETPEKIAADQAVLTGAVPYLKPLDQQPVVIYEEREEVKPEVEAKDNLAEETASQAEVVYEYLKLSYLMKEYIRACEGRKAESTVKGYRSIQKNYFKELQELDVNQLDDQFIQAALDDELRKGLARKTVRNAYRFLKNVLDYGVDQGIIKHMPNLDYVSLHVPAAKAE